MITRVIGGQTYTLTYDSENRLVGVSGQVTATSLYDGDGNRVMGTVSGATTVYIGGYFEYVPGTPASMKKYYAGVAMWDGSNRYYLFADHLGSTSVTADQYGSLYSEMRYKAWGETRFTSGTTPTMKQFTGQYADSYINLYWYGSRWMDPGLGRFIQPDTIIPDQNNPLSNDRYAYAFNNSINCNDPTGHWPNFNFKINTQGIAQDITNWALDATGLSNQGITTTDIAKTLTTAGTCLDVIAEATDMVAVGLSAAALVAGSVLGAPEIGYGVGEALVQPILLAGNVLASEATAASIGSDLLTGDAGLQMSVQSHDNSIAVNGKLSIGTGSTIGIATTAIGWIPGLPSYASLGIQSIAVANDFNVGQKLGVFTGTSFKVPIHYSSDPENQDNQ